MPAVIAMRETSKWPSRHPSDRRCGVARLAIDRRFPGSVSRGPFPSISGMASRTVVPEAFPSPMLFTRGTRPRNLRSVFRRRRSRPIIETRSHPVAGPDSSSNRMRIPPIGEFPSFAACPGRRVSPYLTGATRSITCARSDGSRNRKRGGRPGGRSAELPRFGRNWAMDNPAGSRRMGNVGLGFPCDAREVR